MCLIMGFHNELIEIGLKNFSHPQGKEENSSIFL